MRISTSLLFLAPFGAAVAILAFACGGSSTSPDNPDASAMSDAATEAGGDATAACTAYATARCQKFDACTSDLYSREHFANASACVTREALGCMAGLAAADTAATPAFFQACAAATATTSCEDFFNLTNIPQACLSLAGARANGRACSFNAQCQSTWCDTPRGAACGACAVRPAAGAACTVDSDCGGRGLTCSAASTCAAPVAAMGTCDDAHPCGFGLSCIGKAGAATCQADAKTAGAACDVKKAKNTSCQTEIGLYCGLDDLCKSDALVSAPAACGRLVVTDAGAADGGDGGDAGVVVVDFSIARCIGGAACDPSTSANGTCIAPAAEGAACDRVSGPPCLAPARCVTASDASTAGTCVLPGASACP